VSSAEDAISQEASSIWSSVTGLFGGSSGN
jgi:hypothetical protein